MANIGKKNWKIELYVVHVFHIRSMEPSKNKESFESEGENEKADLLYVDITFDEFFGNEELLVDVSKVDWGKIKKGK